MANERPRLKLGKRASFVKTHLKQLPQGKEAWEVDFRASPRPMGQAETHYLGLVVVLPEGGPLVYMPVEYTPTVNDLADLLADAMRRPMTGSARRPARIHFGGNPRWGELFPHLNDLGVEVAVEDDLPELEEVYLDFCRQMRRAGSGPIFMLKPRATGVGQQFPAVSLWVEACGRIEVGRGRESGFMARALDDDGPAFEDDGSKTLAEALAALEEGLTERFRDRRNELLQSSPKAKKTRRRRHDARASTQDVRDHEGDVGKPPA